MLPGNTAEWDVDTTEGNHRGTERAETRLRRRCVAEPTKHQAVLLHRLGLTLPRHLEMHAV